MPTPAQPPTPAAGAEPVTAAAAPAAAEPAHTLPAATRPDAQPAAAPAPEGFVSEYEAPAYNQPRWARPRPPHEPAPTLCSPDGRFVLTDADLTVRGQRFLLLELERADLTPVKWLLYYLGGGLSLAFVVIAFLQNWLRTMPFAGALLLSSLVLLYGWRGTNRLRLFRPNREPLNVALPGEAAPWQRLTQELNRRIRRSHDRAAAEAEALLAAADEATRQAALTALAAEEAARPGFFPAPDGA